MSNNVDHDSDSEPALVRLETSERFCSADGDVTFQSSDGVLFKLHRKNLEVCTGGFAPPKIPTLDEIVQLTESASTLELLFQFLYPQCHPDLKDISFDVLEPLAEAAEKYQVYPALNVCKFQMHVAIPAHPVEVMNYAFKHGYPDIADEAAPVMAGLRLDYVADRVSPNLAIIWMRYYWKCLYVLSQACTWDGGRGIWHEGEITSRPDGPCRQCETYRAATSQKLISNLGITSPNSLSTLITSSSSGSSTSRCMELSMGQWKAYIQEKVASIPKFSEMYAPQ